MRMRRLLRYLQIIFGGRQDEQLGFALVAGLARRVVPHYRFTWPELAWFVDPGLTEILNRFGEKDGFNGHRRFTLQQLTRLIRDVPGDTAECGVFKGCGSYIILRANKRGSQKRLHHMFDSFAGLSEPAERDGTYWSASDLAVDENLVRDNLKEFVDARFHKGWIPERFDDVSDRRFAFVHVDVDLYEPTLRSIEFFYERLNPGGVFVCDDYGFLTCPGATEAVDVFLSSKSEKMVGLAGGGGFFLKGVPTSTSSA